MDKESSQRRLSRLARHVSSAPLNDITAHGCAAVPQALAVAEPWIIAGLGTVLWAYTPQLMRLFRKLNPRDRLAGTTLTKEQLEAWTEGLHTIPVGHAHGSVSYTQKNPSNVTDVLHPKNTPLIGVPPAGLPLAMAKRLNFAKILNERLGQNSEATALAHDLVEQIGHETVYTQAEVLEAVHDNWVSDAAGTLDRDCFGAINGMCNKLHAVHGIELAVVTISGGVGQSHAREFACKLFNHWGVGNAEANTGVLIMLSGTSLGPGEKSLDIVTGDGIRKCGVMTDSICQQLIRTHMLPDLRRGEFGKALVHGLKKITDYVESVADAVPHPTQGTPAEPFNAFGGGRRTPSGLHADKPMGPLPPILFGAGAIGGSMHVAKHRCRECGKFKVVTATSNTPARADWVDDAELALAELVDENGRVPRRQASAVILKHAPPLSATDAQRIIGRGMLKQLFMLEVPEPMNEFSPKEVGRTHKAQSEDFRAYKKDLVNAEALIGSADFTRLVILLRQSVTTGCFTDEVAQTTYICSACGHAREPHYARHAVAGHDWDGGHAVAVPRDRNGNDGDRARVYLLCRRSGIRRFLGFYRRDDYRNKGATLSGDDISMWYSMQLMSDLIVTDQRRGQYGVGRWRASDGISAQLYSANGTYSFTTGGSGSSSSSGSSSGSSSWGTSRGSWSSGSGSFGGGSSSSGSFGGGSSSGGGASLRF